MHPRTPGSHVCAASGWPPSPGPARTAAPTGTAARAATFVSCDDDQRTDASAKPPPAKLDQVCAAAVDLARATPSTGDHIGAHLEAVAEGERVVTHLLRVRAGRVPRLALGGHGRPGAAQQARHRLRDGAAARRGRAARAPSWVPWHERLQPGDLGVGDLMPTRPTTTGSSPGYVLSDDPAVEEVSWELGLGRPRVMSREGRAEAAQRWYDGDHGPEAPISTAAPANARCGTLRLLPAARRFAAAGVRRLRQPVRPRRRPGGHRRPRLRRPLRGPGRAAAPVEELPTVYDDSEVESVAVSRAAGSVDGDEPAEPYGHG